MWTAVNKVTRQYFYQQKPYFRESFPWKLFFFEFNLMYSDLWSQFIQVRKLFKGGNYSRAETIRGNKAPTFKMR